MKSTKLWVGHFTTISGNFFANYINIFRKTEVLTIILRFLMGLNLDWFKSYGLRCSLRPRASSANSQKIATDKWPCNDYTWPFFANYMFIFHKTEIQTVILRCWTGLNLIGSKFMTQKAFFSGFLRFCTKTHFRFFCVFSFCVITFVPIKI